MEITAESVVNSSEEFGPEKTKRIVSPSEHAGQEHNITQLS
jgi:hypothetical protein